MSKRQQSKLEWDNSRIWLARAAFSLIAAFAFVVASYAFKPLLALAGIIGLFSLYSMGQYYWHVQRSANAKHHARGREGMNPAIRLLADYPVPFGLGLAVLWMAVWLAVARLGR